jgi:DNA-binding LacI/PurR family transcriptional regulator
MMAIRPEFDGSNAGEQVNFLTTIRDVAREAGVGVGTVSRVLSGHASVAPATRARVQTAMEQLNYHPSAVARALSRRRTDTLEIIMPLFTREFYVEVLRGIEEALASTDYALVIRTVERPQDRTRAFSQIGRADGIVIVSLTPSASFVKQLENAKTPVVLIDAVHPKLPSIDVDHEQAAMSAVMHFIKTGHRRIGLIDRANDPFGPASESGRQRGYRRALAEAGLPLDRDLELVASYTAEGGRDGANRLFELPDPPTAILTGSDIQAIGVIDAARSRGLAIPGDLAVIGYNDIDISRHIDLASVRVPMRAMGKRATELLLSMIEHIPVDEPITRFPAELIIRNSAESRP